MSPVPETPPAPTGFANDEVDLRQLAHVLWRYRLSVVVIAILGAVLGLGTSQMLTRYRSEGLFLTPGMNVGNYKTYEAAIVNRRRLKQFLELSDQTATPAGRLMMDLIDTPGGIQEAIRPAFAFTDRDAKQFGVKSDEASIVGMRLALEEKEPSGESPIRLLGEYVRDTQIKVDMEGRMQAVCLQQSTYAQTLRNAQIEDQFEIGQNEARAETLRRIIGRYPQSAQAESNQVISLEKGGERYLSPVAQLVAVEVAISDLQIAENKRARDRVATGLRKDYYCQARDALQNPVSGRDFLETLHQIQERLFAGQDLASDVVEATANELSIELTTWSNNYLSGMRFVTPPEGDETRVRRPGRALGVLMGGALGILLGILLAFLREWWRKNREAVVAPDEA